MVDNWPAVKPLDYVEVPEFPLDTLPYTLREYSAQLAESYQVPTDLPAMLMLATVGASIAKSVNVAITPDWHEPCNVYVVVALPPANRKSPIFKAVTAPLESFERQQSEEISTSISSALIEKKLVTKQLKTAEQKAANATPEEIPNLLKDITSLEKQIPTIPTIPKILADDVSPEKLASLLAENNGKIALMSAEGGVFEMISGRYSNGIPNLDVYLKGHSGDNLRIDRMHRDSEHVANPALTMGLTVQPEIIIELSRRKGFKGRGLIGRFLYSIPESRIGSRKIKTPPVDPRLKLQYNNLITGLLNNFGYCGDYGDGHHDYLRLSHDACEQFDAYRAEIEIKIGKCGELAYAADWAGKLPGATARIAGIIHTALHQHNAIEKEIDSKTILNAITISYYLIEHMKSAFNLMGQDHIAIGAHHVLDWINNTHISQFVFRDCYQALKGRYKTTAQIYPFINHLEASGYLRKCSAPEKHGPGRRPSQRYDVNPNLYMQPQMLQNN